LIRGALAIALLLAALGRALAEERILDFISDVTVERSGDLVVVEAINVQAEGKEIVYGLRRDFITRYTRADGTSVEVRLDIQSVTRDGVVDDWIIQAIPNGIRLRIGSLDRRLEAGRHDYVIRYRTTRRVAFLANSDLLFWRAPGSGWTLAVDHAEARIRLPEPASIETVRFYTGTDEDRGSDAMIVAREERRLVVRTTQPMPPRSGLMIVMTWQKGVIEPESGDKL
jgi:hypothetical protein